MIGRRWRLAILAATVIAVGSLAGPSAPPVAASSGPCPGTTGVTVVVDYQALGGGVVVRCAPGSPSTGFKALTAAGFTIAEVQNVPGFLCRIDGRPSPAQQACINTPPAAAYWSYWHAARGGTWSSSAEGAKTRTPPPGSVEGWSFSDDGSPGEASPPGIAPPPEPATPKPTVKPTAKPTVKPTAKPTPRPTAAPTLRPTPGPTPAPTPRQTLAPTPGDSPTASPPEASASVAQSVDTPTSAGSTGSGEPSPSDADTSMTPGGGVATVDDGSGPAGQTAISDAGPPIGTLVGVGLVVLIGAGAFFARRRGARREAPDG